MTVMGKATFFGPPNLEARHGVHASESMSAEEREAQAARSIEIARAPPRSPSTSAAVALPGGAPPGGRRAVGGTRARDAGVVRAAVRRHRLAPRRRRDSECVPPRLPRHAGPASPTSSSALRIFKHKLKEGQIERVQDASTLICKNLFTAGTDMNLFMGMAVQLGDDGLVGRIDGTFGKTKFKCVFPDHGLDLAGFTGRAAARG